MDTPADQLREDAVDRPEADRPAEREPEAAPEHVDGPELQPQSGLRDPQRAVRGLGAMVLGIEALVLLLALPPLNMLGVPHLGLAITAVLVLAVASVVVAGMMKRPWAWYAGAAIQVALLPCAVFHWSLAAIGVVFGLVWLYSLYVRRVLSRPPVRDS